MLSIVSSILMGSLCSQDCVTMFSTLWFKWWRNCHGLITAAMNAMTETWKKSFYDISAIIKALRYKILVSNPFGGKILKICNHSSNIFFLQSFGPNDVIHIFNPVSYLLGGKLERDSVSRFLISYCSLLRKDKIVHVFTIFDLKWFRKCSQSFFSNLQCHHTLIINALGLIHGSPIWMTTLDPDDWNSIASMWLWISNEISSPYFEPKSPDQIKNHFLQSYHI